MPHTSRSEKRKKLLAFRSPKRESFCNVPWRTNLLLCVTSDTDPENRVWISSTYQNVHMRMRVCLCVRACVGGWLVS